MVSAALDHGGRKETENSRDGVGGVELDGVSLLAKLENAFSCCFVGGELKILFNLSSSQRVLDEKKV